MGFLDKFKKNKEKEQLKQLEKKADIVEASKKKENKKEIEEIRDKRDKKVEDKKATKITETSKVTKKKVVVGGDAYKVLVRPLVSEKSATQEAHNQYTFIVSTDANKYKIKQAVKEVYDVMPERVRIINIQGKFSHFGRAYGRRKDWKKAIITLPKGRSINIHEGV